MQKLASKFLQAAGILLVVLGIVHLIATRHIPDLLNGMKSRAAYQLALGPTMLNHVLVGVLLIPIGYTTWLAAADRNRSQSWARQVLAVNAIAVAALPISIITFMHDPVYFTAPLFLGGVSLVAVLSLLMLAAVSLIARPAPSKAS